MAGGLGAGYLWYERETRHPVDAEAGVATVVVPHSASVATIAELLRSRHLIDSTLAFQVYVRLTNAGGLLQAGTFQVPHSMNLRQIVALLEKSPVAPHRQVTLIDGWTASLMAAETEKQGIGTAREYSAAANVDLFAGARRPTVLADLPSGTSLEGYLFPDTYQVALDATPGDLVRLQVRRLEQVLTPDLRLMADDHHRSLRSAVIMASIVEREAQSPQDMARVAQVLWKRVDLGMPLEADATVLYAEGVWKKEVLDTDLQVDSPYNTYRHPGLPPGPISNPGLNALRAALAPASTDYLFYLSDAHGVMHFSRTLEEHNALRRQYIP